MLQNTGDFFSDDMPQEKCRKVSRKQQAGELCEIFWEWRLKNFPEFSTLVGETKYNDRLTDNSLSGFERRFVEADALLQQVVAVSEEFGRENPSFVHLEVLRFELETFVEGYSHHAHLFPITILDGPQITFPALLASMPKRTSGDFENILKRLRFFSLHLDNAIELMREGIRRKITLYISSIDMATKQFDDMLKPSHTESPFFAPFLCRPNTIPIQEWAELVDECNCVLNTMTYPSVKKMSVFLTDEYRLHLRCKESIASLPSGKAFYESCLSYHTSTHLSPYQLHEIGLKEVLRIKNRTNEILRDINFQGNYIEMTTLLRRNVINEEEENLRNKFSEIYNEVLLKLPKLFVNLPTAKCVITTKSNKAAPSGFYKNGNADDPGTFFINSEKVRGISFLSYSLALHEMIPGHHLQGNISMQKNVPPFRKFRESGNYSVVPGRFPLYTAFIEGWGLYAEYLGEELGMYKTPYDLLGRLFNEMFRAARLVVDTGLHAFDWTSQRAMAYLIDVVGLEHQFARSEVARYVTWPGQACSYKVGELKILEMRDRASKEMGDGFDVQKFHLEVIGHGELPLYIVQRNVEMYINNSNATKTTS